MASSPLLDNLPPGEPVNLVLLGKTGHGKSATGNTIFGRNIFNSRMSQTSVTDKCKLESAVVGERMINLVDTPGTMDTKDPDATLKEIGTAIAYRPDGFHAFLLVLRPDVRMTNEEWMSITLLKKLFGNDVLKKYTILVFTRGDLFENDDDRNDKSLLEWLQCQGPEIGKFLDECSKRCIIINNKEKDNGIKRKQVVELISLVDRLVKENSRQMYTNDLFLIVQDALRKEEEKIKQQEERIKNEERELKELKEKQAEEERRKFEEMRKQAYEDIEKQKEKLKAEKELADKAAEDIRKKEEQIQINQKKLDELKDNKHENAGAVMAHTAKKIGRSCFPPDALVKLEDGKIIAMADLQVGHKVLSSVSNTKLEYSEVYFFAHLDPWNQSQYINICASKYKLKLTPDHHIFIVGNRKILDTVPAEKIKIGDIILIFNEATSSIQEEIVTHLSRSIEVGIYAPVTMSGSMIVDNVLVSCYVDTVPPKISHSLLWPMRKLYHFSPSLSAWVNIESKDGMPVWVQWIMKCFLRWQK